MEAEYIVGKIKELAELHGFELSQNVQKIANAKSRMFDEDWQRCCCDSGNNERFCCSQLCQSEIRSNGICHCSLFKRKENEKR